MMDLGDGLLTERKTMSATKGGNVWTGKQLSLWATPLWESDRSLRRLQWLTALGLIVASMAMLANWAAWHLPVQLPSGVLPAAGLLVIALIAEWVHFLPRSFAAFRVTLIVLAVAGSIARDADLPLGAIVEGLESLVGDGPVGE